MSSPNNVNSRHTPRKFDRKNTHITFEYIASLGTSNCSVWQACHVALNASTDGCLTTGELEEAIRFYFPEKDFQGSTLIQKLSHSEDFAQFFPDGKKPGRWYLTGQTNGSERTAVNGSYVPTTFKRQHTHITLSSTSPSEMSVWKACHVVLNASSEGCLTTDELEDAIRSHYQEKDFKRNTLNNTLSQSRDFGQVFFEGRRPGRWFLTGETKGVERTNVNGRAPKHVEINGASSTSRSSYDRDTKLDPPCIPKPPFATNTDSGTIGHQPDVISRGSQNFGDISQNRILGFESRPDLDSGFAQVSVPSYDCTGDELPCMADGLQDLDMLSPERGARQVHLPTEGSSFNIWAALEQIGSLTSEVSRSRGPDVERECELIHHTSELPNFPQPYEESLGGAGTESFQETMACGAIVAQVPLHLAYHTMACWRCFEACAPEYRSFYHGLVAADGIPFELPRRPTAASEELEAGAQIPTAGSRFDLSLNFL
ncbi:hypothetical protein FRC01_007907 [Tulasnella sp. 417]|nr:hypothetical protein FRC01_007907 [Tulasnella sp. 417]